MSAAVGWTLSLTFITFLSLSFLVQFVGHFNHVLSSLGAHLLLIWLAWQLVNFVSSLISSSLIKPFNKCVLVTGCDTGFGHALALRLDTLGFHVFAGVLDTESPGAKELQESCSPRLRVLPVNVTSDQSVQEAIVTIRSSMSARGTRLWAVVNNAGVSNYSGVEWGRDVDRLFGAPLAVNALGTVRVTRACLPLLRESRNSRVVLVTSMAGRFSLPSMVAYSMSKHAARAFGEGLRRELNSSNVKVTIIEPAMYATDLTNGPKNLMNLSANWFATPDDLRDSLGELDFETHQMRVRGYLATTRGDVSEVIDVLALSIMSKSPKLYYRVSGLREALLFFVAERLPNELQDLILDSTLIARFVKVLRAKRSF